MKLFNRVSLLYAWIILNRIFKTFMTLNLYIKNIYISFILHFFTLPLPCFLLVHLLVPAVLHGYLLFPFLLFIDLYCMSVPQVIGLGRYFWSYTSWQTGWASYGLEHNYFWWLPGLDSHKDRGSGMVVRCLVYVCIPV